MKLKRGDLVTRKSYNHDTVFKITNIKNEIYYLKGTEVRLYADSPESDLVKYLEKDTVDLTNEINTPEIPEERSEYFYLPTKILHIDGDKEYLEKPRKWDLKSLKNFMLFMGPLSSCFDMIVFASLWFIFNVRTEAIFQTIWFSYGVVSNLVGMHIIRTAKIPFVESNAHKFVYFSSILLSILAILVPFTALGHIIGLVSIPLKYLTVILGVPILYCFVALFAKKIYVKKYGEWI